MKGRRIGMVPWYLLLLAVATASRCGETVRNAHTDVVLDAVGPELSPDLVLDGNSKPDAGELKDLQVGGDADADLLADNRDLSLADGEADAQVDVQPDVADSDETDSNPFPEEPHLCGYQLAEGEFPYNNPLHLQEGLGVAYDVNMEPGALFYYPKRMWLLPDGKTLRVAVLWINGLGVSVGNSDGVIPDQHAYASYCWKPIPTVLPSGFIYWDVDTETLQVSFRGETVLAPSDYWGFSYGEPFYRAATQFALDGSKRWLMEVPVGEDVYRFSACPAVGPHVCKADSVPSSGALDPYWESLAVLGQTDPASVLVQNYFDVIFTQREIWSLRRFGPKGEFQQVIPLPISVHQLPQEKILRSGCACEQTIPAVDWACSQEGPYMCGIDTFMDPPHEHCWCNAAGILSEMPPPEEQSERAFTRAYFSPLESQNGLVSIVSVGTSLWWAQFNYDPNLQCQENGTGTLGSWPALEATDQMIVLGPFNGTGTYYEESCSTYARSRRPSALPPYWEWFSGCYHIANSLCPGIKTCVDMDQVNFGENQYMYLRMYRDIYEPASYPDPSDFISATGVDPRVPCDLEWRAAVPIWDW